MRRPIGHADSCTGGRCRGGCWKSNDIASFSIDKSQIGRKKADGWVETPFSITGKEGVGKSAWALHMAQAFGESCPGTYRQHIGQVKDNEPGGVAEFDLRTTYSKMKSERVTEALEKNEREQRSRYIWESLGRLLGKAYAESDTAFFAFLEGFDRGRTNEEQGRPALGRRVK